MIPSVKPPSGQHGASVITTQQFQNLPSNCKSMKCLSKQIKQQMYKLVLKVAGCQPSLMWMDLQRGQSIQDTDQQGKGANKQKATLRTCPFCGVLQLGAQTSEAAPAPTPLLCFCSILVWQTAYLCIEYGNYVCEAKSSGPSTNVCLVETDSLLQVLLISPQIL